MQREAVGIDYLDPDIAGDRIEHRYEPGAADDDAIDAERLGCGSDARPGDFRGTAAFFDQDDACEPVGKTTSQRQFRQHVAPCLADGGDGEPAGQGSGGDQPAIGKADDRNAGEFLERVDTRVAETGNDYCIKARSIRSDAREGVEDGVRRDRHRGSR